MKKLTALVLALALALSVSLAFAGRVEPDVEHYDKLGGTTFNATVGDYDPTYNTFTLYVTAYEKFDKEDVDKLAVGDIILAGGWIYKIQEINESDGYKVFLTEDYAEIYFDTLTGEDGDDLVARNMLNGKIYTNVVAVLHLPVAADIVLEDDSDPDLEAQPIVTKGLEEILKVKAEKDEGTGLDGYATTVTVNENMEIVKIHQGYDVTQ